MKKKIYSVCFLSMLMLCTSMSNLEPVVVTVTAAGVIGAATVAGAAAAIVAAPAGILFAGQLLDPATTELVKSAQPALESALTKVKNTANKVIKFFR